MPQISDITTGKQSVAAAGAVTGSLDTSAITGDFTVRLRVSALASGKRMIIALQDTANATPFSDAINQDVRQFVGEIVPSAPVEVSIQSYQLPLLRYGAANTKLRFNVLSVDGSPAGEVHGWLER